MDIEFIKDSSVVIGLWVLFYKIAAWQLEHRGKRNIDLAEETLALFYEAKDVISWMRHPLGYTNETDSVERKAGETDDEFNARKRTSFIFVRYNQNKELFSKIHSLRYRFMAQIGKEKAEPFVDLNKIINEIISATRLLPILWLDESSKTEDEQKRHHAQIMKNERIIWDSVSEDDPINTKINKLISDIEEICKGVIMAKGTLHGLLNQPITNKK